MPGRSMLLLSAVQQQLLADEASATFSPARGGVGGGFKLHQGRLPSEPKTLPPQHSHQLSAATAGRRRPLYVAPNNEQSSRTTTLENVMNQRASRKQQPAPEPPPPALGAAPGLVARPPSKLLAEIDAAHELMTQSPMASPRGVTSSVMQSIGGGGGSRIDHGRRKGQLSARNHAPPV